METRPSAFSTSYFLKICSEIALHLDQNRATGNVKSYLCAGWKSLVFITFSTIWVQILVMNIKIPTLLETTWMHRRTFMNWITDMTIFWAEREKKTWIYQKCVVFFSSRIWIIVLWVWICPELSGFPRTPIGKLTKQPPKLEVLKVGPASREASRLHGNPPIPKIMTPPHLIPSPSVDKETGSGGLNTRQQQQERLNTKYNTALLPPSPPPSSVYFILCLSLLSRQLWLVNICRGSNLYLRKHKEEELMLDY